MRIEFSCPATDIVTMETIMDMGNQANQVARFHSLPEWDRKCFVIVIEELHEFGARNFNCSGMGFFIG